MNIKILNLFFLISVQFVCAQISGTIIELDESQPLDYATAALFHEEDNRLQTGVITNQEGFFEIKNIPNGRYYLELSFIGYSTKKIQNLELSKSQKSINVGVISLELGNQLGEIELRSERSTVIHKIDRQVFDSRNFQSSLGGTAIDVIKNLPSVSVNGLGEISIRGSKGFAVLINGKPTQGQVSAILAQLPANSLDKIEVITAPSAKYDPDGKGGILNIITKKGATNGVFSQVNVRGGLPSIESYGTQQPAQRYGIDATINSRTDLWNISASASYNRNDKTGRRVGELYIINLLQDRQTFLPSDGERSFDDVNYNGRLNLEYTPNKSDRYSVGFFAGKRTKERLADITYYDNQSVSPIGSDQSSPSFSYYNHNLRIRRGDFILGSFDYDHDFTNGSKLTNSVLYEYTFLGGPTFNDNVDTPEYNTIYQQEYNTNDNPLNGFRYNLDYTFKSSSFGQLEAGYQFRTLNHKGDFIYERDGVLVPEFSSNIQLKRSIHSGYSQFAGTQNKWDYKAGIRLESMNRSYSESLLSELITNNYSYDYMKLFPSASLQYTVNDDTKIKAAYSKRVNRTTTLKMNSFAEREHSEVFEQGDNRLLPEFIDLVELGITKEFDSKNSAYATLYYRHVDNVINRVNTLAYQSNGVVIDSILNRVYSNVGKSNAKGIEVGAQFKLNPNWSNFIGANIFNYDVDGQFVFRHRDGIDRNYKVKNQNTVYSFNVNSTYALKQNASIQFTFNYISERNTAQGKDSRFYTPNLTLKKSFLNNQLVATLQWQNMDMGLLKSNEQSIATSRPDEFYTYTNYVYEVDMVILNISYTFNKVKNRSKFIKSEFGKREF
jgi:outer membrane receptor protein involved in Fe transport